MQVFLNLLYCNLFWFISKCNRVTKVSFYFVSYYNYRRCLRLRFFYLILLFVYSYFLILVLILLFFHFFLHRSLNQMLPLLFLFYLQVFLSLFNLTNSEFSMITFFPIAIEFKNSITYICIWPKTKLFSPDDLDLLPANKVTWSQTLDPTPSIAELSPECKNLFLKLLNF